MKYWGKLKSKWFLSAIPLVIIGALLLFHPGTGINGNLIPNTIISPHVSSPDVNSAPQNPVPNVVNPNGGFTGSGGSYGSATSGSGIPEVNPQNSKSSSATIPQPTPTTTIQPSSNATPDPPSPAPEFPNLIVPGITLLSFIIIVEKYKLKG
jgi:hypothetical protein